MNAIDWASWGPMTAIGHGTVHEDNCEPSCAQGTGPDVSVEVVLSHVVDGKFTLIAEEGLGDNFSISPAAIPGYAPRQISPSTTASLGRPQSSTTVTTADGTPIPPPQPYGVISGSWTGPQGSVKISPVANDAQLDPGNNLPTLGMGEMQLKGSQVVNVDFTVSYGNSDGVADGAVTTSSDSSLVRAGTLVSVLDYSSMGRLLVQLSPIPSPESGTESYNFYDAPQ